MRERSGAVGLAGLYALRGAVRERMTFLGGLRGIAYCRSWAGERGFELHADLLVCISVCY